MKRIARFTFGSKKRAVLSVLAALALITASAAFAAWIVAAGSGSAKGSVATAQIINLPITAVGTPTQLEPGTSRTLTLNIDHSALVSGQIVTITSATVTGPAVRSGGATGASCVPDVGAKLNSHLTFNVSSLVGQTVGPGPGNTPKTVANGVTANASLDLCLSGVEFNVPIAIQGTVGT